MTNKIIKINVEKCIGCGICANTCKQNAIEIIDGKAKVVRESSCDGIGNCLPVCPVNAITFSDAEVKNNEKKNIKITSFSCPGSMSKTIQGTLRKSSLSTTNVANGQLASELMQWPVQIKLVPSEASYFENSNLLVAADCTAFAYANFHQDFIKNRITLIGCPKLDEGNYTEKLTEIIRKNKLKSVTVIRMEVPCCGGIEKAVKEALFNSNKMIPWQVVTISTDGRLLE